MPPERKANITVLVWACRSRPKTSQGMPLNRSGKTNSRASPNPMNVPKIIQTAALSMKFALALFSLLNITHLPGSDDPRGHCVLARSCDRACRPRRAAPRPAKGTTNRRQRPRERWRRHAMNVSSGTMGRQRDAPDRHRVRPRGSDDAESRSPAVNGLSMHQTRANRRSGRWRFPRRQRRRAKTSGWKKKASPGSQDDTVP